MTNQAVSSTTGASPRVAYTAPPEPKDSGARIVNIALPNIPTLERRDRGGFFTNLGDGLALWIGASVNYFARDDNKILKEILTDETELALVIEETVPQLLEFISPFLPETAQGFLMRQQEAGELFVNRLLMRIIANMSLSLYPPEQQQQIIDGEIIPDEDKISANVLAERLFNKFVHLIGEDFNAIDEKIVTHQEKLSVDLFRPTLEKIYDLILPPEDGVRKFGEYTYDLKEVFIGKGSKGCFDLYESLLKWMKKEETVPSPEGQPIDISPLHSVINRCVKYVNKGLKEKWQEEDSKLFEQLTGSRDLHLFMEKISPQVYEQLSKFFPKELAFIFHEDSLEESTKTFLLHALVSIAKEVFQKELQEGTIVTPEHLIERAYSHFTGKIREQFEKAHQKQAKGEVVTASDFAPISADIIKIFIPEAGANGEYQWLHTLIERRNKELAEPLHHILHSLYLSQPGQGKVKEYQNRLKDVFRGEVGADAAAQEIYNLSGNLAAIIQGLLATPLKDSQKVIEAYGIKAVFQGNDENVGWFETQMQQALEYMIFRSLVHLFEKVPPEDRHPPGQLLMKVVQKILAIGMRHLPQILAHLKSCEGDILYELRPLINPESPSFISDKEQRKIAVEREMTRRLEVEASKKVEPFLNEFMGLFFENEEEMLEDQIPFIGEFNNPICKKIRVALSKQFSKMIVVTTSWMQDRKKNETRLGELYQSKNPMKLCTLLGHMGREGLTSYLRDDSVYVTDEVVMPFLKTYLSPPGSNPDGANIDLSLIQRMLQGFFVTAGTTTSPVIQQLMDFVANFTDTLLLRLMADFSKRLKTMEEVKADPPPFSQEVEDSKQKWIENAPDKSKGKKGNSTANRLILKALITNPEVSDEQLFAFIKFAKIKAGGKFLNSLGKTFQQSRKVSSADFISKHEIKNESLMEGIVLKMLGLGKDHFDVLGGIAKGKKKDCQREEVLAEFERAGKLHPAVRGGAAKDEFFKKWSHQIFQVTGISEKSYLPIPEFLKGWLWNLIQDTIVPKILVKAMDAARKPTNLNKLIVAAIKDSADAVKNDEDSVWAKLIPDEDAQRTSNSSLRFNDSYQSKLEEGIAGIFDAVIQPQGNSIPRFLMNIKVKEKRPFLDKTATAVGQAFRGAILRNPQGQPVPTLELLNTAMGLMADSMAEVEWSDSQDKVVFPKTDFEGKKIPPQNGTVEYTERPNLNRFFPKTEEEKRAAEAIELKDRKQAAKDVPHYLRKVISKETKSFVADKFLESWNKFEAKFKEKCPTLYKIIMPILTFLVKIPLRFTIVLFLDMCIWCIVNAVLKLVLSKQIEKYAQDTNVDAYDNMLHKGVEFVMDKIAEGMGQVYVEDEITAEEPVVAVTT